MYGSRNPNSGTRCLTILNGKEHRKTFGVLEVVYILIWIVDTWANLWTAHPTLLPSVHFAFFAVGKLFLCLRNKRKKCWVTIKKKKKLLLIYHCTSNQNFKFSILFQNKWLLIFRLVSKHSNNSHGKLKFVPWVANPEKVTKLSLRIFILCSIVLMFLQC